MQNKKPSVGVFLELHNINKLFLAFSYMLSLQDVFQSIVILYFWHLLIGKSLLFNTFSCFVCSTYSSSSSLSQSGSS